MKLVGRVVSNGLPRIYKVNVYAKGSDKVVMVWEGRAVNNTDAFAQARHAYAPYMHNSAMTTLIAGRRDA